MKQTKKDKPYFVCNSCGMQVFIRGKTGIQILDRLFALNAESRKSGKSKTPASRLQEGFSKLKAEIGELKADRGKVESAETPDGLDAVIQRLENEINNFMESIK